LTSVQSLGSFAQATGKTIVHESKLENTFQSIENGHLTLGCGISRDFDFVGFRDIRDGGGWLFCIRLGTVSDYSKVGVEDEGSEVDTLRSELKIWGLEFA
jgi:hypothetical protein